MGLVKGVKWEPIFIFGEIYCGYCDCCGGAYRSCPRVAFEISFIFISIHDCSFPQFDVFVICSLCPTEATLQTVVISWAWLKALGAWLG